MIQRILLLPDEALSRYDLSSLRITSISGSALPGELAIEWMDRFGDSVYNLYGLDRGFLCDRRRPQGSASATPGKPPHGRRGGPWCGIVGD